MGILVGLILVIAIIAGLGIYGGKRTKGEKDFLLGGANAGPIATMGALMSCCIGGAATVGSTETAFKYGMYGAWQNLVVGLSFILMTIIVSKFFLRLRDEEGLVTLSATLTTKFGKEISIVTGLFSGIALAVGIITQIKSSTAIMLSIIDIPLLWGILLTCALILLYMCIGGVCSTRLGGLAKAALTYAMMISALVVVLSKAGGLGALADMADAAYAEYDWRSMTTRGFSVTCNLAIPYLLGQMCSQAYAQSVFQAKDYKAFSRGAILAAILIAPLGFIATAVGLYMRATHPDLVASKALATFISENFNSVIAGIFLGAMFLNVLGTAATFLMGSSTNFVRDFYYQIAKNKPDDKKMLLLNRCVIVVMLGICVFFAYGYQSTMIQTLGSLSMTLRICATLIPLLMINFWKGTITKQAGIAAAITSPLTAIICKFANVSFPAVFIGIFVGLVTFIVVNLIYQNRPEYKQTA